MRASGVDVMIDERAVRRAEDRLAVVLEACFAAAAAVWERFEARYGALPVLGLVPVPATSTTRARAIGADRWRGRVGTAMERFRR